MSTLPDEAMLEAGATDVRALPLTQEEGFVFSRAIGRRVSVGELVRESGMPGDHARKVISGLLAKGALVIERKGIAVQTATKDPYATIVFSPVDMAEVCDLTIEQRKRILYVDMHLGEWSHYALLQLKRTAASTDIKSGYAKASKEFHPDAYFRKNLGRFKERVDRIFKAMHQAYKTLTDVEKRAAYDEGLVADLTPEEEADLERLAAEKKLARVGEDREARHQQRLKEARLKKNPMIDRIKRGKELLVEAEKSMAEKKVLDAERHAKLALDFAPHDEGIKKRAKEIVAEADRDRAHAMVKRAESAFATDDLDELNRLADQIAELERPDADLLIAAGRMLVRTGRKNRAFKLLSQATELAPKRSDGWELYVELANAEQKYALALRGAEKILELKPSDPKAKDLVKAARKNASR